MTTEQNSEFMSRVRWSTFLYIMIALVPMLIAFIWFLSGIKADVTATRVDVKDARTEAREQLTAAVTAINRRIDSNEFSRKNEINAIWLILNNRAARTSTLRYYTEKMENGKMILVPVK